MTDYSVCPKCGGIIKGICKTCADSKRLSKIRDKIYCTGCKQYLPEGKFSPSVRKKKSCRCVACETDRIRFYKDKIAFICKRDYEASK